MKADIAALIILNLIFRANLFCSEHILEAEDFAGLVVVPFGAVLLDLKLSGADPTHSVHPEKCFV